MIAHQITFLIHSQWCFMTIISLVAQVLWGKYAHLVLTSIQWTGKEVKCFHVIVYICEMCILFYWIIFVIYKSGPGKENDLSKYETSVIHSKQNREYSCISVRINGFASVLFPSCMPKRRVDIEYMMMNIWKLDLDWVSSYLLSCPDMLAVVKLSNVAWHHESFHLSFQKRKHNVLLVKQSELSFREWVK